MAVLQCVSPRTQVTVTERVPALTARRNIMGKHLNNLAHSFIGQLGAKPKDLEGAPVHQVDGAQALIERFGERIVRKCRQMTPATLGRIAAQGVGFDAETDTRNGEGTSLYQVHCGSYLDKYSDGKSLLVAIATTAIVAEMTDILRRRQASMKTVTPAK